MFVRNHMTPHPITITSGTSVQRAAALFEEHRIRHLPVLDEAERLVGILTDRDLRSAVGYDVEDRLELTAGEIMTAEPVTVSPDTPLEDALLILCERRFGALPVVSQGRLVGILSQQDVLAALAKLLGLDQPGSRIEVALPERKADLAAAFDVLGRSDVDLISAIASRVRDDGDEPALYLRVATNNRRPVESELRRAGLILLVPEDQAAAAAHR